MKDTDTNKPTTKSKIKQILLNKYLIISVLFVVWMVFFDENSLLMHYETENEIKNLKDEKTKYEAILSEEHKMLTKLKTNKSEREKYARENYFMKKNNEDIFIIVTDSTSKKP